MNAVLSLCVFAVFAAGVPGQAGKGKLDLALESAAQALRAGDATKAMEILQKVGHTGGSPDANKLLSYAHQMRGLERYEAQKMDLAYRDYFAANRLTPGDEKVLQSLGIITYRLARYDDAAAYMKRVLAKNPKNPQAMAVLGYIAKRRDNVGAASKYLQGAAEQLPERADLQKMAHVLGKEAAVEEKFLTLTKGNFRVQFERGKHVGVEKAVQSVHQYLEQAFRDLRRELGATPGKRITVVVYNQTQYRRVARVHAWARAYFDGKIRVAIRRWPADRMQLRQDLRHELTHAFLHALYPKTPVWMHEGLAQIVQGHDAAAAATGFRNGKYRRLPLETFLGRFSATKDAREATDGYAQALALVGHLKREGGRRQLQRLLREFGRTADPSEAVRLVYGESVEDLIEAALK